MKWLRKNLVLFLTPAILIASMVLCHSQIADFLKVRIVDYAGGQASKPYADKIANNQGAIIANGIINVPGQLMSRQGQALFNVDTNAAAFQGLGQFLPDQNTSYMMAASAPSIIRSTVTDTKWTVVSGIHTITSGIPVGFIQANSNLFIFDGTDPTAWYNGTDYSVSTGWPTSPPTAKSAAWMNNYLFLAGNTTNPDWIFVSQNLSPTSFPSNTVMKINTGDGQPITQLMPYRTGDLVAYKSRSIFDINISGVDATCSPQPICQWSISPLVTDVGTPAPRSVVSLGNDQWFLSSPPYAIRSLTRSQFDKTFINMMSQPIQDIFDGTSLTQPTLNTVQVSKSAAVYFDNKYIIAIPTGSSSVNNFVCVYDFITSSWFTITGWYPAAWQVFNNNLYYIDANDGRVVQCFTGNTGDIGTDHPVSQPTVGISFDYISKIFDFDNPDNYKLMDSLGLEFQPSGNYDATINLNFDNSGWQLAGTIPLTANAPTLPQVLPFVLSSPGITYRTIQLSKFGRFKKVQVEVTINGVSQQVTLQKVTIFARQQPWNRMDNN